MHVGWIATWRVHCKEDQRRFNDLRNAVYGVTAEEEQLAGAKFHRIVSFDNKDATAGDDLQVFVAGLVVVLRYRAVDAEEARTGGGLVGEAHVEEHGVGGRREGLRESGEVKDRFGRLWNRIRWGHWELRLHGGKYELRRRVRVEVRVGLGTAIP